MRKNRVITAVAGILVVVVVVVVALLPTPLASGAQEEPIDWTESQPGFSYQEAELSLTTVEGQWTSPTPIKLVAGLSSDDLGEGYTPNVDAFWSNTCPAREQKVSFSRTLNLPGAPSVLKVSLDEVRKGLPRTTLQNVQLKVNGSVLGSFRGAGGVHALDVGDQADRFVYGENVFTLTARKEETDTACNKVVDGKQRRLGVWAHLYARFASDIQVTREPPNTSGCCVEVFTVTNLGPSVSPEFNFGFTIYNKADVRRDDTSWMLTLSQSQRQRCPDVTIGDATGVSCRINALPAGQSETFYFSWRPLPDCSPGITVPCKQPPSRTQFDVFWSAAGYFDPNVSNGAGQGGWIICSSDYQPQSSCQPPP